MRDRGVDLSEHLSDVNSEELAGLDPSSSEDGDDGAEVRAIALPTPRRMPPPSPASSYPPSKKGTSAKKSSILRF